MGRMTEKHSMPMTKRATTKPVKIAEAKLTKVTVDGRDAAGRLRYRFSIVDQAEQIPYTFFLSESKAMLVANAEKQFPVGASLKVSGRTSSKNLVLNHVKIHMIDGQDARAWAERNRSTQIDPDLLDASEETRKQMDDLDKLMRNRAPGEFVPLAFKGKKEAFEGAMYIVRRQMKKKNPVLTKTEIRALRDALNILNGSEGG